MICHGNMVSCIAGIGHSETTFRSDDTHLSYLPLAHIYERAMYNLLAMEGGRCGIFGGDVKKLKEDMALLQPTVFVSVPRLYNKFFTLMKSKVPEIK